MLNHGVLGLNNAEGAAASPGQVSPGPDFPAMMTLLLT